MNSTLESKPPVAGLPEGVELVKIGVATKDDYEIVGGRILKGPRPLAASGVIVKPAEGYIFVEKKFDIKTYETQYAAVKQIDPATVKETLTFTVDNQGDLDAVNAGLAHLKTLPGFVSSE